MYPLWKCQFLAENVRLSSRRMWHKTMVRWVGLSQLGGLVGATFLLCPVKILMVKAQILQNFCSAKGTN